MSLQNCLCTIRVCCSHVLLLGIFAARCAELKLSNIMVPADDGGGRPGVGDVEIWRGARAQWQWAFSGVLLSRSLGAPGGSHCWRQGAHPMLRRRLSHCRIVRVWAWSSLLPLAFSAMLAGPLGSLCLPCCKMQLLSGVLARALPVLNLWCC